MVNIKRLPDGTIISDTDFYNRTPEDDAIIKARIKKIYVDPPLLHLSIQQETMLLINMSKDYNHVLPWLMDLLRQAEKAETETAKEK